MKKQLILIFSIMLISLSINAQVKVYTMDGCGRCKYTVQFFKSHRIDFVEYNVKNKRNQLEMAKAVRSAGQSTENGITMPVIVDGGEVYANIDQLEDFLDSQFANTNNINNEDQDDDQDDVEDVQNNGDQDDNEDVNDDDDQDDNGDIEDNGDEEDNGDVNEDVNDEENGDVNNDVNEEDHGYEDNQVSSDEDHTANGHTSAASRTGQEVNSISTELTSEEKKLYDLIMEYRREYNLPSIPLSKSLTFVAKTHALDVYANRPDQGLCNAHSWSNKGKWTACCYTPDHKQAQCMWNKPKELTNYKDYGFEIAYSFPSSDNFVMTAEKALEGWKGSPGHNSVIVNLNAWKDYQWQAIGICVYKGIANVWFGRSKDTE